MQKKISKNMRKIRSKIKLIQNKTSELYNVHPI